MILYEYQQDTVMNKYFQTHKNNLLTSRGKKIAYTLFKAQSVPINGRLKLEDLLIHTTLYGIRFKEEKEARM